MLSTFETGHDELSHRKWVERLEYNGSSFLQAPFQQLDIKSRVIEHSAHTPASQILLVTLNKSVWTPRKWHQRCPTTNRTPNLPTDDQFAASIAMIVIDHPHSHTVETVPPPRPHTHTQVREPRSSNSSPTAFVPSPTQRPDPKFGKTFHSEWLTETKKWAKCDKEPTHMFRGTHGTNQNFIPWPRNTDVDSTGCQHEPLPQTLNQLLTSAQLKYLIEGRNLGQHRKLRVSVSGSIRNQIFSERVFSVPNN